MTSFLKMMKGFKLDLNVDHKINIPVKSQLNIKDINQFTLKKVLEFCDIVNSLKTPNNEIPNPMIPEIQIYNTMLR
jgi:hypothetical protein